MQVENLSPPGQYTDAESMLDLDTVIIAFFRALPEPTDAQLHAFAGLIGMDFRDLEERVFSMVGQEIESLEDQIEDLDQDDIDDLGWDSMDLFLVGFFMHNTEPSEEQIHALADLVGIPAPDLEERVYSLLSQIIDETEDPEFLEEMEAVQDLDFTDTYDEDSQSQAEERLGEFAKLIQHGVI